jgi:glycosyltransferase involved in cell wall biosynthesis
VEKCVVLVPAHKYIEPDCEIMLHVLEDRGYTVRRTFGNADISAARSRMASRALDDGFDELMWIDSDIAFHPDDVEKLRGARRTVVGGVYPVRDRRRLACVALPETEVIKCGADGGIYQVRYIATGFLHTRRAVYEDVQRFFSLPLCTQKFVPYFANWLHQRADGQHTYLGEDYAFCERAAQAGHNIFADTTIRLGHIGPYPYMWEDISNVQRAIAQSFHYRTRPAPPRAASS